MISLRACSPEETAEIGARLGAAARPGDLILLYGEFGAGKTTLAQGIARGIGIGDVVASPSFSLVNEHHGPTPLLHLDLYRLRSIEEAIDLGLEDLLERPAIVVVEWPEVAAPLLPADRLSIQLLARGDERELRVEASGPRAQLLLGTLM